MSIVIPKDGGTPFPDIPAEKPPEERKMPVRQEAKWRDMPHRPGYQTNGTDVRLKPST